MSVPLVVDASIATAWITMEDISAPSRALISAGEVLIAPELIVAEVGNALWKAERRGQVSREQVEATSGMLANSLARMLPTLPLLPAAAALARELNHPIYDCFYLALAQHEGAELATADARMVALCARKAIPARLIVPPQPSAPSA